MACAHVQPATVKAHALVIGGLLTSGFGPSLREDIGATNEVIGNGVACIRRRLVTVLNIIPQAQPHARTDWRARQLTHQSSMRENVFEHMVLGQLGAELLARGVDYDEFHSSVDKDGFDVLLEAGTIQRPTQLKVKIAGGARSDVSVHTRLAARPSGCVVWLTYDPVTRSFCDIRWFGSAPGKPLPDLGDKVARHSRANSQGIKAERPLHRVVAANRFERLDDIAHLADKLFGRLPHDPLDFLLSRLRSELATDAGWLTEVANGDFAAIPADLGWGNEATQLAHLMDGYRLLELLELLGGGGPDAFLERQRQAQRDTGHWPGDAALLWTTLFMEARADRFGGSDAGDPPPCLDLLCRQLRHALVALETSHA